MHLDCRPIRRFTHPNIQVLALPGLEEHNIIAVVELRQLIQLIQFGFRVQLCIFATVRE